MSENPYAFQPDDSKAADDDSVRRACEGSLHSMWSVVWATVIGSVIGGAIVIAISLSRLGRSKEAWMTVIITSAIFLPLLVGAYFLPDDWHLSGTAIPQVIVMYMVAKRLYGREYERQVEADGPISSGWKGLGIGILSAAGILMIAVPAALMYEGVSLTELFESGGTAVNFGNNTVYVIDEATEAEGQRLGEYLTDEGFFDPEGSGADVTLKRNGDGVVVSFVMSDGAWTDPDIVHYFQFVANDLTELGFGPPVTIEICNDNMVAMETVRSEATSATESEPQSSSE